MLVSISGIVREHKQMKVETQYLTMIMSASRTVSHKVPVLYNLSTVHTFVKTVQIDQDINILKIN